jgi:hypothetical protein
MSNFNFDLSLKLSQGEVHDFSGVVQKFSGEVQTISEEVRTFPQNPAMTVTTQRSHLARKTR